MKVWNNYIFQGETVTRAYIVRVHKEGQEIMKTKKGGQCKKKKINCLKNCYGKNKIFGCCAGNGWRNTTRRSVEYFTAKNMFGKQYS